MITPKPAIRGVGIAVGVGRDDERISVQASVACSRCRRIVVEAAAEDRGRGARGRGQQKHAERGEQGTHGGPLSVSRRTILKAGPPAGFEALPAGSFALTHHAIAAETEAVRRVEAALEADAVRRRAGERR